MSEYIYAGINKLKPSIIPPPTEYIVRSGNEIESWSFGTPEHYDEIVRDLIRYQSKKPWVGYWVTGISNPDKQDSLFFPLELDGHQFSQAKLKAALLIMIRMILRNEGRIYYSAGVCRNRELAFETRFPTYVNPFPDPKASEFIRNQFTPFSTKASTTEEIPNASSAE